MLASQHHALPPKAESPCRRNGCVWRQSRLCAVEGRVLCYLLTLSKVIPPFLAFFFLLEKRDENTCRTFSFKKRLWVSKELITYQKYKLLSYLCMCYMSFTYFLTFHPIFFCPSLSLPGARTLFKFMKKFEAVLSEPCRSSLVESDKEEQPDFLPRPTDAAASEESPIQSLNRALRETLLARPAAAQVLARGIVFAYSWASCVGSLLSVAGVSLALGEGMPLKSSSLDEWYSIAWPAAE